MVFYVKGTIDKEYLLEMVKKVGAERTTLGSDLGQIGNPSPIEGIRSCVNMMLEMGISDEEIDLMIRKNPAKLLGLE
jgi:predicted metal-dependent TIM-barrel fold hydrolase